MTERQRIASLVKELPESRATLVRQFIEFLLARKDAQDWAQLAVEEFDRNFGADEPDYEAAWKRAGKRRKQTSK